jgi:DNA-binding NarL/FixJ family response regulator
MDAQDSGIVAVVRDLMFSSRITAAARSQGRIAKIIRDPQQLAGQTASLVLIDLSQPDTIEAAVRWKASNTGKVIGFVSHVDAETIARAREAGIDRIMPRGQFVLELAQILSE